MSPTWLSARNSEKSGHGKLTVSVCCSQSAPGRSPYKIATGRLDGKVSLATNAVTLPGSRDRISDIVTRFSKAGFSAEEVVILSGNPPIPLTGVQLRNSIH